MKHFLLLPLLVVVPLVPIRHAIARTGSGITASTTAHGVKLTLVVPRRTYPRNALVKFSVTVQNVSHYVVLTSLGSLCGLTSNPSIEVSNGKGQPTPQLPSSTFAGSTCGAIIGRPLLPQRSERLHVVGVMSGAYIRAVLHIGRYLAKAFGTPRVQIRLTASTPLIAAIHQSNIGPYATVRRPARAKGPLYFVESAMCGSSTHPRGREVSLVWSPIVFNRVYSGCAGPQNWHGLAGYLNYPVATISYTSQ
jgi:hypothetical protein